MTYRVDKEFYSDSSAIRKVGLVADNDELIVEFTSGDMYVYYVDDAPSLFEEWFRADSAGKWYRDNIMGLDNDRLYDAVVEHVSEASDKEFYGELIDSHGSRVEFNISLSDYHAANVRDIVQKMASELGLELAWATGRR